MHTTTLKHVIRDSVIFLLSVLGIVWVYRTILRMRRPVVRIVVFHDVPNAAWFESMIGTLIRNFHVITPQEFYAGTYGTSGIPVLITFDDGYASWNSVAVPVLKKYNVTGIFFINSGLIDAAHDKERTTMYMKEQLLIAPKETLSWEGVRALERAGHVIGGHSIMHTNLTTRSTIDIEHEVVDDRRIIEGQLSVRVTDFAYPFGTKFHMNEDVREVVRRAGYRRAYTAISRFAGEKETFMIPRMCIESDLTPRALARWVRGGYDLFAMMKDICAR